MFVSVHRGVNRVYYRTTVQITVVQRFAVKLNRNPVSRLALAQEVFSEEKHTSTVGPNNSAIRCITTRGWGPVGARSTTLILLVGLSIHENAGHARYDTAWRFLRSSC